MLVMTVTMFAFAGVYALLGTMIGNDRSAIASALRGGIPPQASGITASRCFSRA